ncbi:hypothetical protein OESDEN_02255 [Oesophagostomum dentatum]|uniref:Uncharacterized protein n=1 Tax=Oesophagostomum dentatum TaxID=61180 RepID=A0A0B1TQU6_OESDE|nr:hypothetical protein OESDEN_02255 [Oesophagostomum dentatum]
MGDSEYIGQQKDSGVPEFSLDKGKGDEIAEQDKVARLKAGQTETGTTTGGTTGDGTTGGTTGTTSGTTGTTGDDVRSF